jgi:hypothetical protein
MKSVYIYLDYCCDHPRTLLLLIQNKTTMKKEKVMHSSSKL